ncbi:3-beta hydroxysteroid dehydrogenase/isomerase [Penicillium viridicatum]|nr:3-beta hydroxysteroid dehydrogenase/isomerase [Penicillium viridicatum]
MDGKLDTSEETPVPICVDVRYTAKAHVRAYEEAIVFNQRYSTSSTAYTQQQFVDIMKKHFPSLERRLPAE